MPEPHLHKKEEFRWEQAAKKKINSWKVVPYCVVIPCVLIYLVFFYIAAVEGAVYSFTDWNGVSSTYNYIGFGNLC